MIRPEVSREYVGRYCSRDGQDDLYIVERRTPFSYNQFFVVFKTGPLPCYFRSREDALRYAHLKIKHAREDLDWFLKAYDTGCRNPIDFVAAAIQG